MSAKTSQINFKFSSLWISGKRQWFSEKNISQCRWLPCVNKSYFTRLLLRCGQINTPTSISCSTFSLQWFMILNCSHCTNFLRPTERIDSLVSTYSFFFFLFVTKLLEPNLGPTVLKCPYVGTVHWSSESHWRLSFRVRLVQFLNFPSRHINIDCCQQREVQKICQPPVCFSCHISIASRAEDDLAWTLCFEI